MTTDDPYVAIVILNFNGQKNNYLHRFLPTVYEINYSNFGVYVIDNCSTDASLSYLRDEGFNEEPDLFKKNKRNLIALSENHWFAAGYNIGLAQIDAPYYLLLNSDVEVSPNILTPMVQVLNTDPSVAACQPKIRMYDQRALFEHAGAAGGWVDYLGYPFCRGRLFADLEEDTGQYDDNASIFWASGAALCIRSQLFKDIGGFHADFKAHMEEIDLCWRIKRMGYQIRYCSEAVVWHVGGGTLPKQSPFKTYLNFRNSLTTLYLNTESKKAYVYVLVRLVLDGLAALKFLMAGEFANIVSIVKAHWYFFINAMKLRSKRAAIKKQIEAKRIGPSTVKTGMLNRSIVFAHFFKGIKTFKALFD